MQRVSPGTLILLIFAVLFGLVGAYAVKKYAQQTPVAEAKPEVKKEATHRVPVAIDDLPVGRVIAESDFTVRVLSDAQLAKAKLPSAWMDKPAQIVGRRLQKALPKGSAFEPSAFYPAGLGPSVAEKLQPGERAVMVPMEGTSLETALVTPGATVDVVFRTKADEKQKVPDATVTLLSGVRVLAVGQSIQEGVASDRASTVTLAVNETQARALKVVEGRGSMMLALRNTKDSLPPDQLRPTTLPSLLGIQEGEKPFTSQIYRRTQRMTTTFEDGQAVSVVLDPPYGLPVVGPKEHGTPPADGVIASASPPAQPAFPSAAGPARRRPGFWPAAR